jgi:catechol 2,3-dioxygenase-like lactoylglutathione lyase family enzyme
MTDGRLVEWAALTIDCPDPPALADFYAAVLDGTITRRRADGAFVETPGMFLTFRADPDHRPTTWPAREVPLHSHFELVVADVPEAVRRCLELGAVQRDEPDPDDPNLVVLRDPAGNPFCLIRSSVARRS